MASPSHSDDDMTGESQKHVLRRLKIAALFCFAFLLVELVGGVLSGSLAILSDAAHRASDVVVYLVFIISSYVASLSPSKNYTFGFKRVESLVALCSMLVVVAASVSLTVEAVERIIQYIRAPDEMDAIDSRMMVLLASFGVVANVILLLVLKDNHVHLPGTEHSHEHSHDHSHEHSHGHIMYEDSHEHRQTDVDSNEEKKDGRDSLDAPLLGTKQTDGNLSIDDSTDSPSNTHKPIWNVNLNAAFIHALSDLAGSVALLLAALIIHWRPNWQIADPICTIIFAFLAIFSTVGVIQASLNVLMEKVPPGVTWDEVHRSICEVNGISNVHELHIWSVSHGSSMLSVHATAENVEQVYDDIKRICGKYNIGKMALQIQPSSSSGGCITCENCMT